MVSQYSSKRTKIQHLKQNIIVHKKLYTAPGIVDGQTQVPRLWQGIENEEVYSHSNRQEENLEFEAHLKKY